MDNAKNWMGDDNEGRRNKDIIRERKLQHVVMTETVSSKEKRLERPDLCYGYLQLVLCVPHMGEELMCRRRQQEIRSPLKKGSLRCSREEEEAHGRSVKLEETFDVQI